MPMSFDPYVHERLIVIRLRHPSAETSAAMAKLIARRHRTLGAPLMFVLIIGTDCPMPEPDARRQLAADQAALGERCFCTRTVILGPQMRQGLVRSLVTGFSMLPGRARPTIDGSIAELLEGVESTLGIDPGWLGAELIDEGLVTPQEAEWRPEAAVQHTS